MSDSLTVYKPHQRRDIGFFRSWAVMLGNIVESRELVVQLFRRDFLGVYKKSFLGVAWVLLLPIFGVIPVIYMKAANVLNPGVETVPYPAYALLSISIWQMFAGTVLLCSQALSSASSLILQVKFPHEALLVKQCAQQIAMSLLALVLSAVVLLAFGVVPSWKAVFLPLMAVPIFFLGAGIGLVLSVLSVVVTDLERALGYVLQLMLFITPVVYTAHVEQPFLRFVIDWNPLTYLIGDARDVVLYGTMEHPLRYVYAALFAAFVFLTAWRLFFLSEQHIIEKLS
jgi:homopolymeric O-antigen transport system permease protein